MSHATTYASSISATNTRAAARRPFDGLGHAISEQTERLVEASIEENWGQVSRISQAIAQVGQSLGNSQLAERAWQVFDAAEQPDNAAGVKRGIVRLLSACGQTPYSE